jgi:hypothetical protein
VQHHSCSRQAHRQHNGFGCWLHKLQSAVSCCGVRCFKPHHLCAVIYDQRI